MDNHTTSVTRLRWIKERCDELLDKQASGGDLEHAFWLAMDDEKLDEAYQILETMAFAASYRGSRIGFYNETI